MSKIVFAIIGIVVGAVLGVFLVAPMMSGAAAGIGVATGLSAGICSTVQAAQEEGLLTPEQIDQVLNRAASDMAEFSGEVVPNGLVGGVDECASIMERLRSAS